MWDNGRELGQGFTIITSLERRWMQPSCAEMWPARGAEQESHPDHRRGGHPYVTRVVVVLGGHWLTAWHMCVLNDSNQCWYQARAGVYVVSKHRIPIWQKGSSSYSHTSWGGEREKTRIRSPGSPPYLRLLLSLAFLEKSQRPSANRGLLGRLRGYCPPLLLTGVDCLVTNICFISPHICLSTQVLHFPVCGGWVRFYCSFRPT